jgi:hypothetical protein
MSEPNDLLHLAKLAYETFYRFEHGAVVVPFEELEVEYSRGWTAVAEAMRANRWAHFSNKELNFLLKERLLFHYDHVEINLLLVKQIESELARRSAGGAA